MSSPAIHEINDRTARVGDWRGVDAIVFVHGIGGDFLETWGEFPVLLGSDPDLPHLDILLWGYRTGIGQLRSVHGKKVLGHHLITELHLRLGADAAVHLVGHSMGGLVVLDGLVGEMKRDRAEKHPTHAVEFISLFAVPTRGSSVVNVLSAIDTWFGPIRWPGGPIHNQIEDLKGSACRALIEEVSQRIYDPPDDGPSTRRIPIRMVVASRDGVVGDEDRDIERAPFQEPLPLSFDCGHREVKLPTSHEDSRYLALANDVQEMATKRFVVICQRGGNGDEDGRRNATTDLQVRYGRLLRRRFIDAGGNPEEEPDLYARYLALVMRDGAALKRPPFETANRAVVVLQRNGFLGRAG